MKFQFFTVSAFAPEQGQEALNRFCGRHRVVSVDKQFVGQGLDSAWSVCVTYLEGPAELSNKGRVKGQRRETIDYREVLTPHDFAVYAGLRSLRKELARQEGVPAYALFTNEQLAEIVKGRLVSLNALGKIDGVGKARLEKYGDIFIEELKRLLASVPEDADETNPDNAG